MVEHRNEPHGKKRTLLSAIIIIAVIPLTLIMGYKQLTNGKYLWISLLIILYIMIPFFMMFEKRKPQARELVIISVMSALTCVGNLAFYMTTPFQAGSAMVMITGIAFGPEAGFLCGALARFVCNMFAGQGVWTPFQMFSWGLLGFLSGIIFNLNVSNNQKKQIRFHIGTGPILSILISVGLGGILHNIWGNGTFWGWQLYAFGAAGFIVGLFLQRKRLPVDRITLAIYGFFATFIVYGGIMNIAAMIMGSMAVATEITVSWKSLGILYISGVPYDAVHAAGSAFFMFIIGNICIEKAERVKIKYGLY